MRSISKCSNKFFTRGSRVPIDPTDTFCVKNVYLRVITEPYTTSDPKEKAVRLSDELALFSRYYQNQINTDTFADFVRSLRDNAIKLPESMYGEAYQECRSRYIQSPSELKSYIDMLSSKSDKFVEDGRVAYARKQEELRAKAEAEKRNKEPAKTE